MGISPWFVIWTKPNRERQAEHSLRAAGFPTFFPHHCVRFANRQTTIEPLFRRYGFAQPNTDMQWVGMLHARGVSAVLRDPYGVPKPVPMNVIEMLLNQCGPDNVIYPLEPAPLRQGQKVRVMDGPFSAFEGICSRSACERIWVLLTMLGRQVEVNLRPDQVEAA